MAGSGLVEQCPWWCGSRHVDDAQIRRHVSPAEPVAVFRDEPPLTVRVEQDVYFTPGPLPTPPVVRVGWHVITPAAARLMAEALLESADLAELLADVEATPCS